MMMMTVTVTVASLNLPGFLNEFVVPWRIASWLHSSGLNHELVTSIRFDRMSFYLTVVVSGSASVAPQADS